MLSGPPRRRRARPVADAPIDGLLPHTEDLAKGWLLALLEQAPLDQAPAILAGDLTRDGPRLCEAVLRAIVDDRDLRRLEPDGALTPLAARVGALAGAIGSESTSRAVEALQAVIWRALRDQLHGADPDLVSELAERLTRVAELVRVAALRSGEHVAGSELSAASSGGPAAESPGGFGARSPGPSAAESPLGSEAESPGGSGATRTTESAGGSEADRGTEPPAASPEPREPGREPRSERSWPRAVPAEPRAQALWIEALQEEIHRSAGAPLSLLLAELEDAERVEAVESGAVASSTFGEFARAVRGVVRRQDILVCETDTRAWIIARDTGRGGAQALGSRIADAVRGRPPWRGAPLAASVGIAVLGEDGRSPGELIDAAEEARFAAAAAGSWMSGAASDETPDTG